LDFGVLRLRLEDLGRLSEHLLCTGTGCSAVSEYLSLDKLLLPLVDPVLGTSVFSFLAFACFTISFHAVVSASLSSSPSACLLFDGGFRASIVCSTVFGTVLSKKVPKPFVMPPVICEYHAGVYLSGDGSFFHAGVGFFFSMLADLAAQSASLSSSIMTMILLNTSSSISQLVGFYDGLEAGGKR
jgi:hypothetical protein